MAFSLFHRTIKKIGDANARNNEKHDKLTNVQNNKVHKNRGKNRQRERKEMKNIG